MNTDLIISKLIQYSFDHLYVEKADQFYLENLIMRAMKVDDFHFIDVDTKDMEIPDEIVEDLDNYFTYLGYNEKDKEVAICEIFGALAPLPSKVQKTFKELYSKDKKAATDYFYDLCIKNNYVQKTKIAKNVVITGDDKYHLVATINLSKPEKSNKDIAAELKAAKNNTAKTNFPQCAICKENEGCSGTSKTGVRDNLRLMPLHLANDTWYMQYSPYGYFNEHCIVLYKDHIPMLVSKNNVRALLDFSEQFPHYLIGSNSDLPIVGGSILTHEHFQGGAFDMPILRAKDKKVLHHNTYPNLKFSILDWPCFTLKIKGKDKEEILDAIDDFYQKYLNYSNPEIGLINKTAVRHNTITTIVKNIDNEFNVFVVFRNNRTDETHPGGLFHVREKYQHIKNEGIGLIECMGLFVFPARLKRQLNSVNEIVKNPSLLEDAMKISPDLEAFRETINSLLNKEYKNIDEYLLHAGQCMLEDISIFKNDNDHKAEKDFLSILGF